MMGHGRVKKLLYEYLRGELDSSRQNLVEKHLASCRKCSSELEELQTTVNALDTYRSTSSEERSPGFWNVFASQVEERIRIERRTQSPSVSVHSLFDKALVLYRRPLLAFGSGLVIIIASVVGLWVFNHGSPQLQQFTEQPAVLQEVPVEVVADRLHHYFGKSKVLLVGIANMKTEEDEPVDLTAERRASRDLVQEARYLRSQPLDMRSTRLIGNLEKILIEIANTKEQNGLPNVRIIQGGIHQENLLFKIRMAESMYDTSQFLQSNTLPIR